MTASGVVFDVECCCSCHLHQHLSRHHQSPYQEAYSRTKNLLKRESITLRKNRLPERLVLARDFSQANDASEVRQHLRPSMFPSCGSFEIRFKSMLLYSKHQLERFPSELDLTVLLRILREDSQNEFNSSSKQSITAFRQKNFQRCLLSEFLEFQRNTLLRVAELRDPTTGHQSDQNTLNQIERKFSRKIKQSADKPSESKNTNQKKKEPEGQIKSKREEAHLKPPVKKTGTADALRQREQLCKVKQAKPKTTNSFTPDQAVTLHKASDNQPSDREDSVEWMEPDANYQPQPLASQKAEARLIEQPENFSKDLYEELNQNNCSRVQPTFLSGQEGQVGQPKSLAEQPGLVGQLSGSQVFHQTATLEKTPRTAGLQLNLAYRNDAANQLYQSIPDQDCASFHSACSEDHPELEPQPNHKQHSQEYVAQEQRPVQSDQKIRQGSLGDTPAFSTMSFDEAEIARQVKSFLMGLRSNVVTSTHQNNSSLLEGPSAAAISFPLTESKLNDSEARLGYLTLTVATQTEAAPEVGTTEVAEPECIRYHIHYQQIYEWYCQHSAKVGSHTPTAEFESKEKPRCQVEEFRVQLTKNFHKQMLAENPFASREGLDHPIAVLSTPPKDLESVACGHQLESDSLFLPAHIQSVELDHSKALEAALNILLATDRTLLTRLFETTTSMVYRIWLCDGSWKLIAVQHSVGCSRDAPSKYGLWLVLLERAISLAVGSDKVQDLDFGRVFRLLTGAPSVHSKLTNEKSCSRILKTKPLQQEGAQLYLIKRDGSIDRVLSSGTANREVSFVVESHDRSTQKIAYERAVEIYNSMVLVHFHPGWTFNQAQLQPSEATEQHLTFDSPEKGLCFISFASRETRLQIVLMSCAQASTQGQPQHSFVGELVRSGSFFFSVELRPCRYHLLVRPTVQQSFHVMFYSRSGVTIADTNMKCLAETQKLRPLSAALNKSYTFSSSARTASNKRRFRDEDSDLQQL